MPIRFKCRCEKTLSVNDTFAGKKIKCPSCGQSVPVPDSEVAEPDETEESSEKEAANKSSSKDSKSPIAERDKKKKKKKKREREEKGNAQTIRMAIGGGVLLVLIVVLVIVFTRKKETPQESAKEPGEQNQNQNTDQKAAPVDPAVQRNADLKSKDPKVRAQAADAVIVNVHGRDLAKALSDPNLNVRLIAAHVLLEDPNYPISSEARTAARPAMIQTFMDALKEKEMLVPHTFVLREVVNGRKQQRTEHTFLSAKAVAVIGIGQLGRASNLGATFKPVLPFLIENLREEVRKKSFLTIQAEDAILAVSPEEAIPHVVQLWKENDSKIDGHVQRLLERWAGRADSNRDSVVTALQKVLQDPDMRVRERAAEALKLPELQKTTDKN